MQTFLMFLRRTAERLFSPQINGSLLKWRILNDKYVRSVTIKLSESFPIKFIPHLSQL